MQKKRILLIVGVLVVAVVAVALAMTTRPGTSGKGEDQAARSVNGTASRQSQAGSETAGTDSQVAAAVPTAPGTPTPTAGSPQGVPAGPAAKGERYTFVTFYKDNDQASTKMLADVKKLESQLSARADFKSVNVADASQQALIKRYGVDRSPIPLLVVIAPNGAATAGFPREIKKTDFSDVFVSKGKAELLKTMQEKKMAALCLQNAGTKHNAESLSAANALAADKQYSGKMQVIRIDPSNPDEAKLIKELKIPAGNGEAQVAVISNTGKLAGAFSGAVSVSSMVAKLNESCGTSGSCGPSG